MSDNIKGVEPYYAGHGVTLFHGDCLDVLRELSDASVDSLVTDPPAGISFMGREWDHHKGGRDEWIKWLTEVMREALRVLKPGAHGLVWALPRTQHWTMCALEDAGFEIRDCVTHLFGTGFPKSLDIPKAIDKATGAEGTYGAPKSAAHASWIERGAMRGADGDDGWQRPWMQDGDAVDKAARRYEPATDAARQWDGWGTALKPAAEVWILIRKPLAEKTVAANVLEWRTGGINIDATRIKFASEADIAETAGKNRHADFGSGPRENKVYGVDNRARGADGNYDPSKGRWPTNVVLSHSANCVQVGERKVKGLPFDSVAVKKALINQVAKGDEAARISPKGHGDADGYETVTIWQCEVGCVVAELDAQSEASRFFTVLPNPGFLYTAKAGNDERPAVAGIRHSTVKPLDLMIWLTKLVCPPGGTVLDPFAGSGTTAEAALLEGFKCITIEKEADYLPLTVARVTRRRDVVAHTKLVRTEDSLPTLFDDL